MAAAELGRRIFSVIDKLAARRSGPVERVLSLMLVNEMSRREDTPPLAPRNSA